MSKAKFIYVFALYGGMRGTEASIVGSVIFAFFYIIAPAIVLGFANEMTQYMFSKTVVIVVPALIFIGVLGSLVPGVVGGCLLSTLLYPDVQKKEKIDFVVSLKGFVVGLLAGLSLWLLFLKLELNIVLDMEDNLFVFYSAIGILSSSISGCWAAMKLFKDGIGIIKDVRR
jgi:hypothetical protein